MSEDSAVLLTIEQRVRSLVAARMDQVRTGFGAHLGTAVGEGVDLTGTELLSRPGLHTALTTVLTGAQIGVFTAIRAGHRAAGTVARTTLTRQLADQGFQPPPEDPADSGYLVAVLAGLAAAFTAALLDIQNSVREAFDGVAGAAVVAAAARVLTTNEALSRAVRRLGVRVTAAAASAVHRGYTDTQQATFTAYAAAHPYLAVTKQWQVQSAKPCGYCRALDGHRVAVGAEFDRTLAPVDRPPLPVFGDLLGPPRHPNCRCRLVFDIGMAGTRIRAQVTAPAPVATPELTAAGVRRLPPEQFRRLHRFFAASATKIRSLLRKARTRG